MFNTRKKQAYIYYQYVLKLRHLKEFTPETLLAAIQNDAKNGILSDKVALNILYTSRIDREEFLNNKNFARLVCTFFESKPNTAVTSVVLYSYSILGNHNQVISLLSKNTVSNGAGAYIVQRGDVLNNEQKLALLNLIKNNPQSYVARQG